MVIFCISVPDLEHGMIFNLCAGITFAAFKASLALFVDFESKEVTENLSFERIGIL